jgi:Cu(I)/Ag(I) efflux system membrane protein CusA/SilA
MCRSSSSPNYPGQAPQVVEDQVTYPLTTAMMGIGMPRRCAASACSSTSMVYIIFDDGTDLYSARSRVLEYLNFAKDRLPAGVQPSWGRMPRAWDGCINMCSIPATTARIIRRDYGTTWWVIIGMPSPGDAPADRRSALVKVRAFDKPGTARLTGKPLVSSNQDLASLRSLAGLVSALSADRRSGVAEVASIGGFVKEYQVVLKPERLLAPTSCRSKTIMTAVQRSNNDVGGSVVEMSENEYMVRSRGYLQGLADLAKCRWV